MPEERHLLFELPLCVYHSREPPAADLAVVDGIVVHWRRQKIEALYEQVIHRLIVYLAIINQVVNGSLPPAQNEIINLCRIAAEAHASQQVSGSVEIYACHR